MTAKVTAKVSKPVPLNRREVQKLMDMLTLPVAPGGSREELAVTAVGTALKRCLDGVTTFKACYQEILKAVRK